MNQREAVTNPVFGATVIVLLVVAAIGFGLYATAPRSGSTVTSTLTVSGPGSGLRPGVSGGFLNSKVVAFDYTTPYQCIPPTGKLFAGQDAANATAPCEVGAAGTFPNNALPVWVSVPAFAGLSVFGVTKLGASPDGYPVYNNQTILTDCGAGGTATGCPDHPTYVYSPAFTAVEQHLNITSGYGGLPEGVLPTPSHSHVVDTDAGGANIPWDSIAVLVFDPNVMPNPATGRCTQVVPSSLQNATANCLNSLQAIQAAMTTNDSAISAADAGNPIWETLGKPLTQVVLPGITIPAQIRNANTNLDIYFAVNNSNPYPPSKGSQQAALLALPALGAVEASAAFLLAAAILAWAGPSFMRPSGGRLAPFRSPLWGPEAA